MSLARMIFSPLRAAGQLVAAAMLLACLATPQAAAETKIVKVVSPGGVTAWLVEERSIPIISISASFTGGDALIPNEKAGLASLFASMLEEGAGKYDDTAFAKRAEELAVKMSFSSGSDTISVGATMLLQNRDASIELFRLAMQEPRFDAGPLERVKAQISSSIRQAETNPGSIASKTFFSLAYPGDSYGRRRSGTLKSVASLTADDLRDAHKKLMTRETLNVGVVGAISPEELAPLLDKLFAALPAKGPKPPKPPKLALKPGVTVVDFNAPQSTVIFGHAGILRKDPDYVAAYVMNYILGGGGFASRLTEEVREKRGLAYSVYSYLSPRDRGGLYLGGVGTANKSVGKSIELIKAEWARMAAGKVTQQELDKAKQYLIGSYPLRFDSNSKIAAFLVGVQRQKLGIDYITRRNDLVRAVTLDDVKRVAKRLLKSDELFFVVVGKPEGLKR
ncbi:MAG: insulinase family protein [Neomegalonema sp.]|nr:insulinase family protein [Neomegalonema sp.]